MKMAYFRFTIRTKRVLGFAGYTLVLSTGLAAWLWAVLAALGLATYG